METDSNRAKGMAGLNAKSGWRVVMLVTVLLGSACGGGDSDDRLATSEEVTTSMSDAGTVDSPARAEPVATTDSLPAQEEPMPPLGIVVAEVPPVNEFVRPLSVHRPAEAGPWPIAVLFAGWASPRSTLAPFARELAAEGFVVVTTDVDIDGLVDRDYECSQRFAMQVALEHGGDPEGPFITGGHSFGAPVATMASLFDPFIDRATGRLRECGLEEDDIGPTDLVVGLGGAWYPGDCIGDPKMRAIAPNGFPSEVLPLDGNPGVPFIVAHGTDDPICPFDQAETAAAEWEAGGHPTEFMRLEGAGHCEGVIFGAAPDEWPEVACDPDSVTSREVVEAIVAWVGSS